MALHAIRVFDKDVKMKPWKKIVLQKHHLVLQKSENRQVTRFTILIPPPPPIDYCVRINGELDCLFSGDIQS